MSKYMYTREELKKKIDLLAKRGWVFKGFDACNYCDLFVKKEDYCIKRVEISNHSVSIQGWRFDGSFNFETHPVTLFYDEFDIFYELYRFEKDTSRILPKEFATSQKELDRAFKFEMGIDTFCEIQGGALVCGVRDDKEVSKDE